MTNLISSKTQSPKSQVRSHQIVIVGGGAAGITVASQLLGQNKNLDIAIVEPSEKHYYQPGWTLVGGGVFTLEQTARNEKDFIPQRATWIKDYAKILDPDSNQVVTRSGSIIEYEYLVLAPGIQINWHLIKGLKEALGKGGVSSNYSKDYAPYTWETNKYRLNQNKGEYHPPLFMLF